MVNTSKQIIIVARPVHWVKNLSLFAALIFSGNLLQSDLFIKVVWAFISFSLAASAVYILNDLKDAKLDNLHPIKKKRPIASGKLTPELAIVAMGFFALLSLFIAVKLNHLFFIGLIAYFLIQIGYSLWLKNIHIIDILIIAFGFIIRVYSGAFVIDAHLSVWFLLCVISVALFLASGKRRAELNVLVKTQGVTRKSLARYPRVLLNSYVTMFGNAAWMSWSLYTFFESPPATLPVWLFLAELSRTTTVSKLLMVTIPVVIFIIMRYQALIFDNRSETPEKLLLTDIPLIASMAIWTTTVVWVLYFASVLPSV